MEVPKEDAAYMVFHQVEISIKPGMPKALLKAQSKVLNNCLPRNKRDKECQLAWVLQ